MISLTYMYDIIIKNGTVIDGTGEMKFKADVAVKENRIVKVGNLYNEHGETEIDASGLYVVPGFIDVCNHSDTYWQIFLNPDLESMLYQGVTTIVGGNCGSSLAPLASAQTIESIQKWVDLRQKNINWLKMKELFSFLEKKVLAVNFATLVGHGTLRRGILKDEVRSPSHKELEFMKKSLADSIEAGAIGMSTGLVYTHARLASSEELIGLAKVVKKHDGVYVTHIRTEREKVVEAIEEAIHIAKMSQVKLHISHLKVMERENWGKMDEILNIISHARENGLEVTFDVFPYTNTGSVLYTLLPAWVSEGGKKMLLHRLRDPAIRAKVALEMKDSGFDWDKVEISASSLNKTLSRRKITEIASSQQKTIEDAVIDILIASEGRVITSMEVLSEDNVRKAILHPLSIVASNGSGYSIEYGKTGETVHPRNFGTFTKIFSKYVKEERLLTLEEAVKKVTSIPADKFGLLKRGRVQEGYFADIAILNLDKVGSSASNDNPYKYAEGIDFLLVNGKIVMSDGKYLGIRNGTVIKH